MEALISLDAAPSFAVGDITNLQQLSEFNTSELADGLPADFPVLRCPIPTDGASFLPTGDIRYEMNIACLPANDLPVMTMLLQLNDVQIYWLADFTDPEVRAAYNRWKEAGRLPVLLDFNEGNKRDCTLCVPEISRKRLEFEDLHGFKKDAPADYVWKIMTKIADSGLLQHVAVSVLPEFRLESMLVNLLATKRVEQLIKGRSHGAKPNANFTSS
ncbi:hypothetical protein B0G80_7547 [Paraburkholderia sp. BL6669N2]|uniref:hypothetical protein n=1 Tax=Paraburkholderia sp. BL6669N2 TaxID=1938807 RepID=UPI000E287003|nr:hypothetical protein [Paraburkholderia sp. BL6669N2]REG51063.1 hypothetical protein B0G80_7547 [Paraburkholderia sp. BL6669N2]